MNSDKTYLTHINESIRKIENYVVSGKDGFFANEMIQDAVLRNFEIIGEAAKQLSADLKARNTDIDWRRIAGFRDILIHHYFGVDMKYVWKVVHDELPKLKQAVMGLLGE